MALRAHLVPQLQALNNTVPELVNFGISVGPYHMSQLRWYSFLSSSPNSSCPTSVTSGPRSQRSSSRPCCRLSSKAQTLPLAMAMTMPTRGIRLAISSLRSYKRLAGSYRCPWKQRTHSRVCMHVWGVADLLTDLSQSPERHRGSCVSTTSRPQRQSTSRQSARWHSSTMRSKRSRAPLGSRTRRSRRQVSRSS